MKQAILFVCLGNICRSPTAEVVFRQRATAAGLAVTADSAGTDAWHAGEAPHPPMRAAALTRGYDLGGLRSRRLTAADFARFDRVLVMDRRNLADATALWRQAGQGPRPEMFLDHAPGCGHAEMPDPWYSGTYDLTVDLCEMASDGLIAALARSPYRGR